MRQITEGQPNPLRGADKCPLGPTRRENCGTHAIEAADPAKYDSAQHDSSQDAAMKEGDAVTCGFDFNGFGPCIVRCRAKASARSSVWRHRCLTRRVMS
jgi:hypothetical protein